MNYKETIEGLFDEFRSKEPGSNVVGPVVIGGLLVKSAPLRGLEELVIILRFGIPPTIEEYYRSLEVTTPERFKNNPALDCGSGPIGIIFFLRSNILFEKKGEPGKEEVWLNYSSVSGRYYNPATPGAGRVSAIHARFEELLPQIAPLVVPAKEQLEPLID